MPFLTPQPRTQFFDNDGDPLAGGQLFSFIAGTTTPKATFTDFGGLTPNANPTILDSAGRADIWLGTDTLYKLRLLDSVSVQIWEIDNIGSSAQTIDPGYGIVKNVVRLTPVSGEFSMVATAIIPAGVVLISSQIFIEVSFGTSNALTSITVGTVSAPERYGRGISIVGGTKTGPSDYRNYVLEPTTTTLDITVSAEGGAFDAVGSLILTTRHETHQADETL